MCEDEWMDDIHRVEREILSFRFEVAHKLVAHVSYKDECQQDVILKEKSNFSEGFNDGSNGHFVCSS